MEYPCLTLALHCYLCKWNGNGMSRELDGYHRVWVSRPFSLVSSRIPSQHHLNDVKDSRLGQTEQQGEVTRLCIGANKRQLCVIMERHIWPSRLDLSSSCSVECVIVCCCTDL